MQEVVLATAEFLEPIPHTGNCPKCGGDILGFVAAEGDEPELRDDGFLYYGCPHCKALIQEDSQQRIRLAPAA